MQVILRGEDANVVWQRIKELVPLIAECHELQDDSCEEFSDETLARVITFLQTACFGDRGNHDRKYGSKLNRNRSLVSINPAIVRLSRSFKAYPMELVLENDALANKSVSLGCVTGGTVVYPLNNLGVEEYMSNRLPPHEFDLRHIVNQKVDFHVAQGVFIGGLLYLPLLPRILGRKWAPQDDETAASLFSWIAVQVVNFFPDKLCLVNSSDGPTLRNKDANILPRVFTAFSRSGSNYGKQLALTIGFEPDGEHPFDDISGDERYIMDLNRLNSPNISASTRARLLMGWSSFLQFSAATDDQQLAQELELAAGDLKRAGIGD